MKKLAIFASGNGSNAENIAVFFKNNQQIKVELFLTNNPYAFVIQRAQSLNIPIVVFDTEDLKSGKVNNLLADLKIDYIILAGFLWLVPNDIVKSFPKRIINIHPALLPKYGGKGMYGDNVHKTVLENKETESGITIHFVNEKYDEGNIIFQQKCIVAADDNIETLAKKVHALEYQFYPIIIEKTITHENT